MDRLESAKNQAIESTRLAEQPKGVTLSPAVSDATEEEVEYVDEDDSVVVPWGDVKVSQPLAGAADGQGEDEGVYSEDEDVSGE